ncbi:MAG: hypothetical protein OXC57_11705 [Rhodobacteraceae bacterium]|nr:hypothetical protein [Paracoccaceae bacterium]
MQVTADLRTSKNSLSFWRSETEVDLGNAVLAIVANRERIDPIDFIWLKYQELEDDGYSFEESERQTPVIDLVDQHVDITSLNYHQLGRTAKRVMDAIEEKRWKRLNKNKVKILLQTALDEGRIDYKRVNEKLCQCKELKFM